MQTKITKPQRILIIAISALVAAFTLNFIIASLGKSNEPAIRHLSTPIAGQEKTVTSFFWYKCPHCLQANGSLTSWAKALPASLTFERVPVAFDDMGANQQRMYYALQDMGKIEALHEQIFQAAQNNTLKFETQAEIAEWVSVRGIDRKEFEIAFDSGRVTNHLLEARRLEEAYNVKLVPALGLLGKSLLNPVPGVDMLRNADSELKALSIP